MTNQLFGRGTGPSPTHPSGSGSSISITYETKPGLGWLSIKNFLLGVITLTFYRFWAKTAVRKHIWSCVRINGEPLEYTGTGKELFLGAIIIFCIIFLPFIVIVNGLQLAGYPIAALIAQLLFTLFIFVLFGMAIYRARRYRLSRTLWRGVRGTLVGSSFKYSLLYFGTILLSGITLGWSNPAMNLELQERITKDMRFGETPFGFRGTAGPLYSRYAIAWFVSLFAIIGLTIVIGVSFADQFAGLGDKLKNVEQNPQSLIGIIGAIYGSLFLLAIIFSIIWSFYTAYEMAKFASYTYFDNANFKFNATGFSLVALWFGNILMVILTIGIATPFTVQRTVKYFIDRLEVDGWVNVDQIVQSTAPIDSRGEGLMDAFDIDAY